MAEHGVSGGLRTATGGLGPGEPVAEFIHYFSSRPGVDGLPLVPAEAEDLMQDAGAFERQRNDGLNLAHRECRPGAGPVSATIALVPAGVGRSETRPVPGAARPMRSGVDAVIRFAATDARPGGPGRAARLSQQARPPPGARTPVRACCSPRA